MVAGQKCRPLRRGRRPRARACALRGFRWDEPGRVCENRGSQDPPPGMDRAEVALPSFSPSPSLVAGSKSTAFLYL